MKIFREIIEVDYHLIHKAFNPIVNLSVKMIHEENYFVKLQLSYDHAFV